MQYNLQAIKKARLDNCSFVKMILMFMVVLYHSVVFWTGNWFSACEVAIASEPLGYLARWLNSFHIYCFTLVSGYLFYYLKFECGKYQRYSTFLLGKVKRLIIPYWFVALMWVIPVALIVFRYTCFDIIRRFILAENPNQLWFLWMLFWAFALFYPISNSAADKTFVGLLASIISYCIGVVGIKFIPNLFYVWAGFRFLIFFWVGFEL